MGRITFVATKFPRELVILKMRDCSDRFDREIKYDGQDFKWGFQIEDHAMRHRWFKLGLDMSHHKGRSELAATYPDFLALPLASGISAEQMVIDYLGALRKHAEQMLRYMLPASALMSTPIEYVITAPAVWSGDAQAKTRACAEKAGMGLGSALHIVSEPEAAATYTLDAMDPYNIKVGDTFVLVVAGGGMVELISYTVEALRPLEIQEAAPCTGSQCGSSFLNRIFQKTLKDKFQDDRHWDDDILEEVRRAIRQVSYQTNQFLQATKRFETVVCSDRITYPSSILASLTRFSSDKACFPRYRWRRFPDSRYEPHSIL